MFCLRFYSSNIWFSRNFFSSVSETITFDYTTQVTFSCNASRLWNNRLHVLKLFVVIYGLISETSWVCVLEPFCPYTCINIFELTITFTVLKQARSAYLRWFYRHPTISVTAQSRWTSLPSLDAPNSKFHNVPLSN